MEPWLDITFHILFSLLSWMLVYRFYAKDKHVLIPGLIAAMLSGLAIDIDHFIDYFLAFGARFSLRDFLNGEQFSVSGKNYVLFHGYEYVLIALVVFFILRKRSSKAIALTVVVSMTCHLLIDSLLFGIPILQYSLIYRMLHGFAAIPPTIHF